MTLPRPSRQSKTVKHLPLFRRQCQNLQHQWLHLHLHLHLHLQL